MQTANTNYCQYIITNLFRSTYLYYTGYREGNLYLEDKISNLL